MSSKNKKVVIRNTANTFRDFDYSLGNVNLKFSLKTDIKDQLKDFLELLNVAAADVNDELKKHQ